MNLHLWEMAAYAGAGKDAGYEVQFVHPSEVFNDWDDAGALSARCQSREPAKRDVSIEQLRELIDTFEAVEDGEDELEVVAKAARRSAGRPAYFPLAPEETSEAAAAAAAEPPRKAARVEG